MKWHFWLHPLRGIAAILVVFLHSYWTWSLFDNFFVRRLYVMVDLFFVLSGFVISSGYINKVKDSASFKRFLGRRIDRLRFQYISSGLVWLIAALATGAYADLGQFCVSVLQYISLTDFLFPGDVPRINPVTWSVMTEVWVYISFGLLIVLMNSGRIPAPVLLFPVVVATLYLGFFHQDIDLVTGPGPLARAVAGFFTGMICYRARFSPRHVGYFIFTLYCHVAIIMTGRNEDLFIVPAAAVFIFCISNLDGPNNRYIANFMQWLGEISFPLYVWHFLVSVVLAKLAHKLTGGQFITFHGEKFLKVDAYTGNALCVLLVLSSLALAQASIYVERKVKRHASLKVTREIT